MLAWLADNYFSISLLLAVIVIVALLAWWLQRSRGTLVALLASLLLLVFVILIGWLVPTDRKRLREIIRESADAVARHDVPGLVQYVDDDFRYGPVTRRNLADRAGKVLKWFDVQDVHVFNLDIEDVDRAAGKARVAFRVRIDMGGEERPLAALCRVDFRLRNGRWKISGFRLYNAFVNTSTEIRIPFP